MPKRCKACQPAAKAQNWQAYYAEIRKPLPMVLTCARCSTPFRRATTLGRPPKHCSDCTEARRNESKRAWLSRNPELRLFYVHKRRELIVSSTVEVFTRDEIFERDGWVCQICGYRIDPLVKWPHPRSASLDHIVPVSKHGPHTRENTQLACLCCNLAKKDKLVA